MDRRAQISTAVFAAVMVLLAGQSCNWLAGLDDVTFDGGGGAGGSPSTGGTSTTTTAGGTGGTTTAGGTGGVMCNPANCPAPASECKVAACDDMGACIEETVPDGTDAATQTAGDCKKNVCMGGSVSSENDDTDTLDDNNDCTLDTCFAGMPQSDPVPMGTTCTGAGGAKVCDANANCVECLTGNDCAAPNPTCGPGNTCIPVTCTDGMLNGAETDVDCGGGVCDPCDTGQDCSADADCFHGKCGGNSQCAAPTCNDGIENGGAYLTGAGGETDVDCSGPCAAKCGPNQGCEVNGDCDGNECTGMNGTCVPNCADGVMNNAETFVDCGGGTCSGCQVGQPCGLSDSNCVMTAYCAAGTCAAKKAPGVACGATNQCLMGLCDPTDGVCCNVACSGTCRSCKLAGSAGTCKFVDQGTDPENECVGTQVCDGDSTCVKANGNTCGMGAECISGNCVDGVCCNTSCSSTCAACNLAGTVGSCTAIPANQDPDNECAGADCNGSGGCEKANGAPCAMGAECGSGHCVDGVCCDTTCGTTCVACNLIGTVGTCTNIPVGTDPAGECAGTTPNCSGEATCGTPLGGSCGNNNQCGSTFCADGVCCNSACTGDCKACNLAGTVGTCTNVANGMVDTCLGGQTCMNGMCQ